MGDIPEPSTISAFGRDLRAGRISALELTDRCLRRAENSYRQLNAFILLMEAEARRQAAAADRELSAGCDRGPLHGVPISLKDLIDVRGTATTAASRVLDRRPAERDAPLVARLRQAGAVIIGKTNLHEFAYGTTNEDSAFGPVRNPWDPERSPGGSSGGSAASVAAGLALASVGTDTGGSIRIPAAACGIVGLKPAYGDVPIEAVVPLSETLDHAGPLARTVADAAVVYDALAGRAESSLARMRLASELRIGVVREFFTDVLEPEVRSRFEDAVARLRDAGARLEDVPIQGAHTASSVFVRIQAPEAAVYHAPMLETMADKYTAPVRERLLRGRRISAEDYITALRERDTLRAAVDGALAGYDALATPTMPILPPNFGQETIVIDGITHLVRTLTLRLTQLFNLTGHPAISLPCGRTASGLPCGLQIIGARERTSDLLQTALACEGALAASSTAQMGR